MRSWIIWRRCCVLLCRSKKEVSETYCIFSLICYNWGYKLLSTKGIIMEWESYWDNLIEKKKLSHDLMNLMNLIKQGATLIQRNRFVTRSMMIITGYGGRSGSRCATIFWN